jgi:hypothetical protein
MLGRIPFRIDVLTSISGVSFTVAWRNRITMTTDIGEIAVLGLADLRANKLAAAQNKPGQRLDFPRRLGAGAAPRLPAFVSGCGPIGIQLSDLHSLWELHEAPFSLSSALGDLTVLPCLNVARVAVREVCDPRRAMRGERHRRRERTHVVKSRLSALRPVAISGGSSAIENQVRSVTLPLAATLPSIWPSVMSP